MDNKPRAGSGLIERSATVVIAQLAIAATLGLVALPSVLGATVRSVDAAPGLARPEPLIWLGIGLVLTIWLIAIAPPLIRILANFLSKVPWASRQDDDRIGPRFKSRVLAALLVVAVYVALIEAIVRRPLVAIVGAFAAPSDVDAVVAAFSLAVLFAVLLPLYLTARPFIESAAGYALDAVATTSSSEVTSRFVEAGGTSPGTVAAATPAPIRRVAEDEPTVAAPTPSSSDATVPSSANGDATITAPAVNADATRIASDQPTLPRTN